MDAFEWLGEWEDIQAPGRHCQRIPAPDAFGYQYCPTYYGSKVPWTAGPRYSMAERVIRAIPVDGSVGDTQPSWTRSPQARHWLEPERIGILARFIKWLKS